MKIGNPADKPPVAPAATGRTACGDAKGTGAGGQAEASAQVELSNTAAALLSGSASAEFDAGKVARMSQAIADGTFKADPEAIADKLIANAQELLTKAPH